MSESPPMASAESTSPAPLAAVEVAAPEAAAGGDDGALKAAEKKLWKLKVDGREVDFDASDEEALKRHVQKGLGADRRFEEGAAAKKQAEQFINLLKTNPRAVLENPSIGLDLVKFATDIVWEQMQEEKLSPEQRHQRELERQLSEYQKREQEARDESEKAQKAALQSQYEDHFEKQILAALDKGGLPRTKDTVRRMANYMSKAIEHDLDLEPEDLMRHVRQEYLDEHRELYREAGPDVLMSLTGEDFLKKLRDADLKRLKSTQGSQFHTPEPKHSSKKGELKAIKKLTGTEWRKQLISEAKNR